MRRTTAALVVLAALAGALATLPGPRQVRAPAGGELAAQISIRIPVPAGIEGPADDSLPHNPPAAPARPQSARPAAADVREPAGGQTPRPGGGRLVREWHVLHARSGASAPRSDASPCPRPSTCEAHSVRDPRWPTDGTGRAVIPFAYNDEGRRRVRAPDGLLRPALLASMNEWNRWNSNVVFRDEGTTEAVFGADGPDGSCDDGTNVVTWHTFDRDVIGAAVLCFDESGKVIRDADLALNATQHWERVNGEPDSRHSHDIQAILTHELGHWFALADLYSSDAAGLTMYGNTEYGETHKRTLGRGDALGIQKAYPCADGDRCPREGFADD